MRNQKQNRTPFPLAAPPVRSPRGERQRLLVLVFALMTVLVAMNEVRQPQTWAWLWGGNPPEETTPLLDTRLQEPRAEPARSDSRTPSFAGPPLGEGTAPEQRQIAGWRHVWFALEEFDRLELDRLLRPSRRSGGKPTSPPSDLPRLIEHLDAAWARMVEQEVAGGRDCETDWQQTWKPALRALGADPALSPEQAAVVAAIDRWVESAAWSQVVDDTVWRPGDRGAWFRTLERLQLAGASGAEQAGAVAVSFVQIFRQADAYRGKLVSIRGQVRLAYRVPAPRNDLGIQDYCLFWLRPEEGTNLPVVVYALEPPDGFPALTTEPRQVDEKLTVTGYFFKRWAYRARDGLNSVPLLVVRQPHWHPREPAPESWWTRNSRVWGGWLWGAAAVVLAGLLGLAGGVAWLVHWSTRPARTLATRLRREAEEHAEDRWTKLP